MQRGKYWSVLNLAIKAAVSNFRELKKPYKLTLAVTNKCNSKCLRCGIWKSKKTEEWRVSDYKRFFKKNNYFNWIDITGGEVFLRDDLISIVGLIRKYEKELFLLHLPTNGLETELIIGKIKEIIDFNFPKFIVTVSLDGLPSTHDYLRGVKGGWEKALETYRQLKSLKSPSVDCFFGMTVSNENVMEIEELMVLLKKKIPDFDENDVHFNVAQISDHYYKNSDFDFKNKKATAEKLEIFFNKKKYAFGPISLMEWIYQRGVKDFLIQKKMACKCRSGEVSVFINSRGDVYPCAMWNKNLGNLRENDYSVKEIISRNRQWQQEKNKGVCGSCWTPCEAYQSILGNWGTSIFGILGQYARNTSRKNTNG